MTSSIAVVPTGTANLASVVGAFQRLGVEPVVTQSATAIASADGVVVPGVGTFGAAMGALKEGGLGAEVRQRIAADRPTLMICVGFQVIAETSTEDPGVEGLGVLQSSVERLPGTVSVPQLGWNAVSAPQGSRFMESGWAYFANSYAVSAVPDGWKTASFDHGGTFVAAVERGNVLGCQFHPELSGAWGSRVLDSWLDTVKEVA
ncbi:MAG: imidazole glycerol phosphate synthase subunit HisH [Acidimicrobiia bacterium]